MALNAPYDAGFIDVRGQQWPVYVTTGGAWLAIVDGVDKTADTKDKLRELVMRLTKRGAVTISVPFVLAEKGSGVAEGRVQFKTGRIVGVHASNGNYITAWAHLKSREQWDGFGSYGSRVMHPLNDDEKAAYRQMVLAAAEAAKTVRRFEEAHMIRSVRDLVEAAIKKEETRED